MFKKTQKISSDLLKQSFIMPWSNVNSTKTETRDNPSSHNWENNKVSINAKTLVLNKKKKHKLFEPAAVEISHRFAWWNQRTRRRRKWRLILRRTDRLSHLENQNSYNFNKKIQRPRTRRVKTLICGDMISGWDLRSQIVPALRPTRYGFWFGSFVWDFVVDERVDET